MIQSSRVRINDLVHCVLWLTLQASHQTLWHRASQALLARSSFIWSSQSRDRPRLPFQLARRRAILAQGHRGSLVQNSLGGQLQ